jgi:hypothetical protein
MTRGKESNLRCVPFRAHYADPLNRPSSSNFQFNTGFVNAIPDDVNITGYSIPTSTPVIEQL